VNHLF